VADEDDYFHKLDQEAKAKLKARLEAEKAIADREARRELHYFKCGKCGADMKTETFRGLAIEVCTECSAVLLDPGELQTLAGSDDTAVFSSFFSMFGGRRS
jgi:uncharacterized protein